MVPKSVLVLLTVVLAGVAAAPAMTAEDPTPNLDGFYLCDGVNPEGNPYRGFVEIVKAQNTFHLRWTFPQSRDSAMGIGIVSNGVLAVSYYGGTTAGVVVYKIDAGSKMVGEWTVAGTNGSVYKETLTRLPGKPAMPEDRDHTPSERPRRSQPRNDPGRIIQG
ncbi:MAG: hypothetical protein FJW23_01515 [Acidimicrobiia bacterium]|nr:hypothetical protein [Acidimicrobiia bacterium]